MRARVYVAAGVLAVLAVGACSGGGGSGGGTATDSQVGGRSDGGAAHAGGGLAPAAPVPSAPAARTGFGTKGGDGASVVRLPIGDGSFKIRTAQLTVAVKGARNVAIQANAAEAIATGVGGEVDADDRVSGPQAAATLRLRVPPDSLDNTLNELSRLGTEKSRQLSTTDVTQKVADVSSRVRSAQDSINRLRVLFSHATKIGDIIALESELNSREADLESLQAQQRSLDRQTAMATITLSLVTAVKHQAPPAPKHENKQGGFLGGLERGWHGFSTAAVWVASAVGTLLPFLALLLVLALGVRLLWPRLPHHRHPAPTPAPTPSE